jgi:hypothetical protein
MTGVVQDLGYALRQLGKNRGFTIVAVVTLALGIVANTAIFPVVSGVLLNPLPFPQADRIVSMLFGVKPTDPITFAVVAVGLCGIALFACYLPARRPCASIPWWR